MYQALDWVPGHSTEQTSTVSALMELTVSLGDSSVNKLAQKQLDQVPVGASPGARMYNVDWT